ncbi:uncharacterized protein LOC119732212 [Patiria miniata]|uniref:CCHC-type domain-containing protein n=1 Tax=Patiria miniata TaxID=46514 RepID=A0A914ADZ4_PATMI|nr:uncharacterized protein LOC119732212 [Patiria miniata]
MASYVKVQGTGHVNRFPLDDAGSLNLAVLQAQYPTARGLLYSEDDCKVVVPAQQGIIKPPADGWSERLYSVLLPEPTTPPTNEKAILDIQSQLMKLLLKPQTQLVMAPERKMSTFEGKVGEVREFITNMENAFKRYSVPEDQQGAFLLDYLRGGPKAEVKALLAERKTIGEIMTFLRESYRDKLPVGELQRLFLERRQNPGEPIRDYAVDLEKRFLRLTRMDAKLYSKPDSTLAEQFIEGIDDLYLRNSCRDLYERGTIETFRELREYAIKRQGREESRSKPSDVYSAAIQTSALRAVANEVVDAVRQLTQPSSGQAPMTSANPPTYPRGRGCFNCGRHGHIARFCRSDRRSAYQWRSDNTYSRQPMPNYVESPAQNQMPTHHTQQYMMPPYPQSFGPNPHPFMPKEEQQMAAPSHTEALNRNPPL